MVEPSPVDPGFGGGGTSGSAYTWPSEAEDWLWGGGEGCLGSGPSDESEARSEG